MQVSEVVDEGAIDGVIKFTVDHKWYSCAECMRYHSLEGWRQVFWRLGLIGQNGQRYGGAGYGNISRRLNGVRFLISGSQTGGARELNNAGYACVDEAFFAEGRVKSRGEVLPSSESLTHAAVYAANALVVAVVHVHSPLIWCNYEGLSVPAITSAIAYGTREMADAIRAKVEQLAKQKCYRGAIVMLGHEDGVITWGETEEAASLEMIGLYAKAKRRQFKLSVDSHS